MSVPLIGSHSTHNMCVRWWTGSCRRLNGAVRGDHSPTPRCMRKSMVASNAISAWRSTTRSQTNALRKSKPGCRRSGVGYAAGPCRNRKASSRRVREEASRSRGHDRILFARIDIEETQTVQRGQLSQERLQHVLWLQEQLLSWFEQHRRSFPWREPARSSYELVVAVILL